MKNLKLIPLLVTLLSINAFAQDYLCIPTGASGFTFNSVSKKWENTFFRLGDEKNILKKVANGYQWRDFGRSTGPLCSDGFNEYGYLHCNVYFGNLVINKKTLRYVETYMSGYTDGVDKNENTPNIKIGTCSPL